MRKEDRLELKKGRAQPELTPLTRDEVRRLPKVHIGFEQFVEPLAEVAEIYADYLGRGGIDVDEMRAALANYQMLADAHEEAKRRLALIADTRLFNAAKAWKHQLVIYNRARAAGRTNIEIVRAIEKFARFMKPRRRRRGLKAARRTRP